MESIRAQTDIPAKRANPLPLTASSGGSSNSSGLNIRLKRGFKRCPCCGEINAQRALLCRNVDCKLRQQMLSKQRAFDPVQLVTHSNAKLFSVRSKDRDANPRNFVQITDVTLALEGTSEIVSRNAICFVDTCKYDASDVANLACKHVKACTDDNNSIARAEIYSIAHEVLWNLNIPWEQRMRLWDMYKADELLVPAVQRLSAPVFVVKCEKSKSFPAGRLHVQILVNQTRSEKKPKFSCACKKLKIIVEPDNSVVMQEEICDHLLLVLAGVLSSTEGKTIYASFTNAMKSLWMPKRADTSITNGSPEDTFFDFNINITGNNPMSSSNAADDIFIFGEEFLSNDVIPDFSDSILKSVVNLPGTHQSIFDDDSNDHAPTVSHPGDPKLISNCALNEDSDIKFINSAAAVAAAESVANDHCVTRMELSDCNIELMDQFQQLTDQIDLCGDDIALPVASAEFFQPDNINIMTPDFSGAVEQLNAFDSSSNLPTLSIDVKPFYEVPAPADPLNSLRHRNTNSLLKSKNCKGMANSKANSYGYSYNCNNNNNNTQRNNEQFAVELQALPSAAVVPLTAVGTAAVVPVTPPPIEMPTIAVVKKEPLKASEIDAEVKTRYFPHLPAKRSLIVNDTERAKNVQSANVETGPALSYSAWLEHVIEVLNESIVFGTQEPVKHSFHVHEEIFAHFSKSFSVGVKRRMPTSSCTLKTGKHKGLIKYTWVFSVASTVQRIFTTNNLKIELERIFEKHHDDYVPYVKRTNGETKEKYRRIYPKLSLYVAHIWFDCSNDNHKTAFKIEWLPNAFPRSHFGILNIEFSLGYRYPANI